MLLSDPYCAMSLGNVQGAVLGEAIIETSHYVSFQDKKKD